jgi:hypothetical protein
VWDWIELNINQPSSKFWSSAISVSTKFEVWWFFSSVDTENTDRVIIYNYLTQTWSMGKLSRIAGTSLPSDPNPIMADKQYVYRHESGWNYPGVEENPWGETFTINTANGAVVTTVKQMLPEVIGNTGSVSFKFIKRNNPNDDAVETVTSPKSIRDNGYVDVRESARQMRLRVEMSGSFYWSLGVINMDVTGRGKK